MKINIQSTSNSLLIFYGIILVKVGDSMLKSNDDLLIAMQKDKFKGNIYKDDYCVIWDINKEFRFKIVMEHILDEGYIEICHLKKNLEVYITHWHPMTTDIFRELKKINKNVLIIKNNILLGSWTKIISLEEYKENIKKYKNSIFVKYYVIF